METKKNDKLSKARIAELEKILREVSMLAFFYKDRTFYKYRPFYKDKTFYKTPKEPKNEKFNKLFNMIADKLEKYFNTTIIDHGFNKIECAYEILAHTPVGLKLAVHIASLDEKYISNIGDDGVRSCFSAKEWLWRNHGT